VALIDNHPYTKLSAREYWHTDQRCVRNSEKTSWCATQVRVLAAQWHLTLGTGSTADRSRSSWPALMPSQTRHLRPKLSPKISVSAHHFATETREGAQTSKIWRLTRFSRRMSLKNWANKKDHAHVVNSDSSHRLPWRNWNKFHLEMNHGSIRVH